ncbi:MAG: fibronectin type III domain-containing protein [Ruminococcus sp.]|nr:fibronectin type III domain-containing protein [Ruminococcus sp.]
MSIKSYANSMKMSWSKVSGVTGYRVYQYNTSTKKWKAVANTKSTSYTFSKLKAGTTYKYTVRAYKTLNGTTYLSPKYSTFTTSTNLATVSFTVTGGNKKATVKWNKVAGATGYKVYYKTSKNGKWIGLKTTNNKTTSYTKTGLTKDKTYYFTVKAYRTVGGKTYNGNYTTKSVKVK